MSKILGDWLVSTYRAKDCDLSVTDITKPTYQLWQQLHTEMTEKDNKSVGMKSFIGSAVHKAIEDQDEDGVIKELSWVRHLTDGTKIGGTCDELRWRYSINKWRLGDVKTKGLYSAKKFMGVGTKANPNPKPEQEKEILQMSVYRWLFEGMFDIEDKAVIYLIIPGHNSYDPLPEYSEVWLGLMPIKTVDQYIKGKLAIANGDSKPDCDCDKNWMCRFCPFKNTCDESNAKTVEEDTHEFGKED